jgi:hypothetical protein
VGFAAGGGAAAVDGGAGEAFEDRDCWGVRDVAGRGFAHAPLFCVLDVFFWWMR